MSGQIWEKLLDATNRQEIAWKRAGRYRTYAAVVGEITITLAHVRSEPGIADAGGTYEYIKLDIRQGERSVEFTGGSMGVWRFKSRAQKLYERVIEKVEAPTPNDLPLPCILNMELNR